MATTTKQLMMANMQSKMANLDSSIPTKANVAEVPLAAIVLLQVKPSKQHLGVCTPNTKGRDRLTENTNNG